MTILVIFSAIFNLTDNIVKTIRLNTFNRIQTNLTKLRLKAQEDYYNIYAYIYKKKVHIAYSYCGRARARAHREI
jgi:hypothetical protein